MRPLLLASQSPRRRQILSYFGLPFESCTPDYEEPPYDPSLTPKEYVEKLAEGKARSIAPTEAVVVCADTIVVCDHQVFGKPRNREEAHAMLQQLSGRSHQVMSAVCVRDGDQYHSALDITDVWFHKLTERQVELYLDQISWQDKAGAYAVQEAGSVIIDRIHGCYHSVMGLPISVLDQLLQKVGIHLWEHLYER